MLVVCPAAGVAGVVFNLTATAASQRTFVNAWPSGEVEPTTSVLNVGAGEVFANLVVAELGEGGRVSLSNAFGEVHLLADVVGWIPTGSDLATLTPARLLDTRTGVGTSAAGAVGAAGRVDLDVLGRGGVPASGVDSVVVNVTATGRSQRSFVTVWPTGFGASDGVGVEHGRCGAGAESGGCEGGCGRKGVVVQSGGVGASDRGCGRLHGGGFGCGGVGAEAVVGHTVGCGCGGGSCRSWRGSSM